MPLSARLDDVWLDDAWLEDDVSRGGRSAAEFRGGGTLDGSGAGVGSGGMLSSTSEAKLPRLGDGSRMTVLDGILA